MALFMRLADLLLMPTGMQGGGKGGTLVQPQLPPPTIYLLALS